MHRTGFGLARAGDRRRLRDLVGGAAGPVTHAAGVLVQAVEAGAVDHLVVDADLFGLDAVVEAVRHRSRFVSLRVISDEPEVTIMRHNLAPAEVAWRPAGTGLIEYVGSLLA